MDTTQSQIQHSSGGVKEEEWTAVTCESKEEEESWPLIKRGFTVPRKKELEERAAINKHICEGQNPSFLGYNLQGFGCENMMMDPEPGRCRRTDGKKWRCSRDVLSEQKYCERHIHRGRQRSRKLVEPPGFASSHSSPATTIVRAKAESSLDPNLNLSVSVGLQLMTPSSTIANVDNDACGGSGNKRACYAAPLFVVNDTSTTVSSAVATNARVRATMYDSGTDNTNEKKIGHGILIRSGSGSNDLYNRSIAVRSHISQGLGFSPKSVLQVAGGDNLFVQSKSQSHVAFEPGRCRRTDGKKWQCRREVVPAQKYCPRHMHRGAKRLGQTYAVPTTTSPVASNTVLLPRPPPMAERRCPAPNTNLCISTPTSPPLNDESSSSTSSDTTITDTSS